MKKMVRFLAVALAVTLLSVPTLTGCGSTKDVVSAEGSSSIAGVSTTTTSKVTPVTLKFYTDTDEVTNAQRKWPEFIAQFEKNNPDIKVEMAPLVANVNYDEYRKKASLMLAAGEQIDLIRLASADEVSQKVDGGALEPLDEYAKKEGINLSDEYKGIELYKGNVYSIPDEITPWLVFLNQDLLEEAGLPVPARDWTWDDYRTYAKKLTKGEGANKVYGSYMHTWSQFLVVGAMSKIMDIPIYTKDMKENFGDPIFKDSLKLRYDLENVDNSQVPYIDLKSQKMAYRTQFFSGKAAMVPMGAWMVSDIQLLEKYPHTFKTTFAPWPRWDTTCKPNTSLLDGAGMGWTINANSEFKDQAYKFLRALTTDGLAIAGNTWTAWKKADAQTTIKGIAGSDESLYDMKALRGVLFDPERVDNIYQTVGPAQTEISEGPWAEESEKYLVGGQSLDVTIANIQKKASDLIAKASK